MQEYLSFVKSTKTEATYRFYDHHLHVALDYFKVNKLKFTSRSLYRYIDDCKKKGLTNQTINYRILALKQYLKFKSIDSDILSFPKLKIYKKSFDFLSYNEICSLKQYILSSNISIENKLILSLFVETGIRLTELLHIEINNIDLDKRCIMLTRTKTHMYRKVCYSDLTKKYLDEYVPYGTKYLFNRTASGVHKIFLRANKVLRFKKFHPHMLRHTFATMLLKNGASLELVRKLLGHTSLETTQIYLHLLDDDIEQQYNNFFKI